MNDGIGLPYLEEMNIDSRQLLDYIVHIIIVYCYFSVFYH